MNISYKLAEELKDAGFPQNTQWKWCACFETNDGEIDAEIVLAKECVVEKHPSAPNLSELIEACGEDFDNLMRVYHGQDIVWVANADDLGHSENEGFTPTIAVARLWLALNKKP